MGENDIRKRKHGPFKTQRPEHNRASSICRVGATIAGGKPLLLGVGERGGGVQVWGELVKVVSPGADNRSYWEASQFSQGAYVSTWAWLWTTLSHHLPEFHRVLEPRAILRYALLLSWSCFQDQKLLHISTSSIPQIPESVGRRLLSEPSLA